MDSLISRDHPPGFVHNRCRSRRTMDLTAGPAVHVVIDGEPTFVECLPLRADPSAG